MAAVRLSPALTVRIDDSAIGGVAAWHALVRRGEPRVAAVRLIPEKVEDHGGGSLRVYARFHALVDGKERSSSMGVFDCVADTDGLAAISTSRHHLTFLLGDNARYRIFFGFTRLSLALGARGKPRGLEASRS
jgi:hypothetical protein